jgi:hypothetical protein
MYAVAAASARFLLLRLWLRLRFDDPALQQPQEI